MKRFKYYLEMVQKVGEKNISNRNITVNRDNALELEAGHMS